jgi:hypothetical protein
MATSQEVSNLAIYNVRGDQNAQGEWTQHVRCANDFAPAAYDKIELGYTGTDLTSVVYKLAGATVATLTLVYVAPGGNLTSVTRT